MDKEDGKQPQSRISSSAEDGDIGHVIRGLRAQQQSVDMALQQLQLRAQAAAPHGPQQPQLPLSARERHELGRRQISSLADHELDRELRRSEAHLEALRRERFAQQELFQRGQEARRQQRLLDDRPRMDPTGSGVLGRNPDDLILLQRIREEQRSLEEQMNRLEAMARQVRATDTGVSAAGYMHPPERDDRAYLASRMRESYRSGDERPSARADLSLGMSLADLDRSSGRPRMTDLYSSSAASASLPALDMLSRTSSLHDADRALLRQLESHDALRRQSDDTLLPASSTAFLPQSPYKRQRREQQPFEEAKETSNSDNEPYRKLEAAEDMRGKKPAAARKTRRRSKKKSVSDDDDGPHDDNDGDDPAPPRRQGWIRGMALPSDKGKLTVVQALIRQSLEYFLAQDEDALTSVQGRKQKIRVGQIGVRCKYCAHVPLLQRSKGAVHYPKTLLSVYQAAQVRISPPYKGTVDSPKITQNIASAHLNENDEQCCRFMPTSVREELEVQRPRRDASNVGKSYWVNSCRDMGVIEKDGALWLDESADIEGKESAGESDKKKASTKKDDGDGSDDSSDSDARDTVSDMKHSKE